MNKKKKSELESWLFRHSEVFVWTVIAAMLGGLTSFYMNRIFLERPELILEPNLDGLMILFGILINSILFLVFAVFIVSLTFGGMIYYLFALEKGWKEFGVIHKGSNKTSGRSTGVDLKKLYKKWKKHVLFFDSLFLLSLIIFLMYVVSLEQNVATIGWLVMGCLCSGPPAIVLMKKWAKNLVKKKKGSSIF